MQRSTVVFLFHLLLFCVLSEQNFSITGCQRETAYNVLDNNQSSLTCTGLLPLSNIYWSFTGPSSNGTEIRLGQCYVYNTTSDHNNCTDFDTDFAISRLNKTFTTLRFVSNVENIHGGLIKCSQFDNNTNTQAYCAVRKDNTSAEFHIPECSSGLLEVNENQSVSLTCTGLWLVSNTYWSITDNDAEVSLGNCSLCYHNCSSKPCEVPDRRYTITRSRFDVTTLEFLSDMQSYDGATVKCSQLYSETTVQANCTIRILQGNTTPTTGTNTTTNVTIVAGGTSTFPLALVTGGAGAATLVIIFIIVVAVVVRRSKRKKGPIASEENVPTSGTGGSMAAEESSIPMDNMGIPEASSQSETDNSYAGLQMSEVGLRSVYNDIDLSNTSSQLQPATTESAYAGLRTSAIGLRSVYSDIDHSNTRSQSQTAATENAYVGLRASGVGLRSVYISIEHSKTSPESQTEAASSTYKTLEMSDDGLRLVYTAADHTNTDTHSHAAPQGAYAHLEMSDNAEVDDNENKPANDGEDYESAAVVQTGVCSSLCT